MGICCYFIPKFLQKPASFQLTCVQIEGEESPATVGRDVDCEVPVWGGSA
jgi:hypothetical protein